LKEILSRSFLAQNRRRRRQARSYDRIKVIDNMTFSAFFDRIKGHDLCLNEQLALFSRYAVNTNLLRGDMVKACIVGEKDEII
jgi:hypothetical protein